MAAQNHIVRIRYPQPTDHKTEAPAQSGLGYTSTRPSKEIQRLEVAFKDSLTTFKAGDMMSGTVTMELVQELKITGVQMLVHGVARASWDEERAYTKGSSGKLSHRNAEVLIDEMVILTSKADTLAPGRYNWPFSLRLPLYLPATFEDTEYGRVQYMYKIVVERPWKGAIEVSRSFTVLGMLDLNTEPEAKKPGENQGELMIGSGCCKSGPVSCHFAVPKRGFTVGQNIPFTATIENNSSRKLEVRVVLIQEVTFRVDKQVRKTSTPIIVTRRDGGSNEGHVKPGETVCWAEESRKLSVLTPTRLGGGCKMIELKYFLTLIAMPSGLGKDIEIPIEVIIGTVPLRAQLSVDGLGGKRSRSPSVNPPE